MKEVKDTDWYSSVGVVMDLFFLSFLSVPSNVLHDESRMNWEECGRKQSWLNLRD